MKTLEKYMMPLDTTRSDDQSDTLLIAIGNNARSDDGLGWAFLDLLTAEDSFNGEIISCYQLQVEDAELISNYKKVIFVDAYEGSMDDGFIWEQTEALNDFTFTTHALTPSAVLYLCKELYHKTPTAYTLKIQGNNWELKIGISDTAKMNLEKALLFFKRTQNH